MLSGLLRTVADVLLADTERGRMARTLIRGFLVGDDADIQDGPVRSLPQPPDGNVPRSSDSSTRTKRVHAPARNSLDLASLESAAKSAGFPNQDDWPALRDKVRQAIAAKGLTRRQAATDGGFNPGTFARWLSASARPPGPEALGQLRAWVEGDHPQADVASSAAHPPAEGPAAIADDPLPATRLLDGERERLSGYLSLGGDRHDLRQQFGTARDVLEKAAMGQTLNAAIIDRVRTGLNGAAPG